jgi:hypothetical protein
MPDAGMKRRRVVHKSTAGILQSIPEAVGLVGNPPPDLTKNTVAGLICVGAFSAGPSACPRVAASKTQDRDIINFFNETSDSGH